MHVEIEKFAMILTKYSAGDVRWRASRTGGAFSVQPLPNLAVNVTTDAVSRYSSGKCLSL